MGDPTVNRSALVYDRPPGLAATGPAEARGLERDAVRLLVSTPAGNTHARFSDLPNFLRPGDLLVVNASATLPASLPAEGRLGSFILNFSTRFGGGLWLAEPRPATTREGPMSLRPGESIRVGDLVVRAVAAYPGLPRLWFVQAEGSVDLAMARYGRPIRYGYLTEEYPLDAFQAIFASLPGSAEMPSAGRPFSPRVLDALKSRGVELAEIVLHAGVSSLEVQAEQVQHEAVFPEPFWVFPAAAAAVNAARQDGRRVIAVGTTVVRALESAWDGSRLRPKSGFSRLFVHPGRPPRVVDGLITGLHDPATSHLALLYALAGRDMVRSAYEEAIQSGYLWHEFGDSHLILPVAADVRSGL